MILKTLTREKEAPLTYDNEHLADAFVMTDEEENASEDLAETEEEELDEEEDFDEEADDEEDLSEEDEDEEDEASDTEDVDDGSEAPDTSEEQA